MADTNERTPLLKVEHLSKEFPAESGMFAKRFSKRVVSAVNDISFEIYPGETFGLVGESGCGKSTTGRTIMRLTKPTAGKVFFRGKDVAEMSKHEIKDMRREMQFIFQDPYASLNPRMTIGEIVSEPMTIHGVGTKEERIERVRELLDVVGLNPEHINRYPHEFSGGQRQRVGIARAFALKPKLIICDEPVSALDVSIQAQVLNLLKELQDKFGTAYLFIAHDLSVVQHISDRVAVMYLGKMVEVSDWKTLYSEPHHPYTQSLLSAVPVPDPDIQKTRKRIILAGDPPSPLDPPTGCRFHTRCPIAQGICSEKLPEFKEVAPGHCCACHSHFQVNDTDHIQADIQKGGDGQKHQGRFAVPNCSDDPVHNILKKSGGDPKENDQDIDIRIFKNVLRRIHPGQDLPAQQRNHRSDHHGKGRRKPDTVCHDLTHSRIILCTEFLCNNNRESPRKSLQESNDQIT